MDGQAERAVVMARRKPQRENARAEIESKGFDDFEVKLGDAMRGERATLGKSLLDVQRELRIKASYISAIENCDASVFETPGFVAGYVRSYARYLKMDPEDSYERFCAESGFAVSRGLSSENTAKAKERKSRMSRPSRKKSDDLFDRAKTPFIPMEGSALTGVSPHAIGSSFILIAVIVLIAYGAWTVLNEIQKVSLSPVEQAPEITSTLTAGFDAELDQTNGGGSGLSVDAFDRIYRPQALDVPIIIARDAPISTLDPSDLGLFVPPEIDDNLAGIDDLVVPIIEDPVVAEVEEPVADPIVVEEAAPQVALLAIQEVWVRVRGADGTIIFEKILAAGEEYLLPQLEEAPVLRSGNSGSLFFKVAGEVYGPAGDPGSVAKNVALSVDNLTAAYSTVDPNENAGLAHYLALAAAE
jgi:cytoskeleton protein RodZ